MGLRKGAGAESLMQPGAPAQTMAGLQSSAAIPVSDKPVKTVAPAGGGESSNVFDQMSAKGGAPSQGGGGAQPPEEGMANKIVSTLEQSPDPAAKAMALAARHATMVGGMAGQAAGGALGVMGGAAAGAVGGLPGMIGGAIAGGHMGDVAGSAIGAALGSKLEAFVNDKPQPDTTQLAMTATEYGALTAVGAVAAPVFRGAATMVSDKLRPITEALTPEMEAAMAPVRQKAGDIMDYAAGRFQVMKHKLLGDSPAAAALGNKAQSMMNATGTIGQQEMFVAQKAEDGAIAHDLNNMHDILPKPYTNAPIDPKTFVTDWIDRTGKAVGVYKEQVAAQMSGYKADVSGAIDAIGANLRKNGILNKDGTVLNTKGISEDESYLLNTYQGMKNMAQGAEPQGGSSMIDEIWKRVTSQAKGIAGAQLPKPGATIVEASEAKGGQFIDMDHYEALLRRVQKEAATQGGDILPQLSKQMTDSYYGTIGKELEKQGNTSALDALKAANAHYSAHIDFAGSLSKQIEKNPDGAINLMVKADQPEFTANAMRLMTPDQQKTLARSFVAKTVRDGLDVSSGQLSAKSILQTMTDYGDKNLDLLLGAEKEPMMKMLSNISALQKGRLSYGAENALIDSTTRQAVKGPMVERLFNIVKSWTGGRAADVFASPEFADKIGRMSTLANRANTMKNIGRASTAIRYTPTALGGALSGMSADRTEAEQ